MMMVMMADADAAGKLRREDTAAAAADVDAVVVALSMFVSQ